MKKIMGLSKWSFAFILYMAFNTSIMITWIIFHFLGKTGSSVFIDKWLETTKLGLSILIGMFILILMLFIAIIVFAFKKKRKLAYIVAVAGIISGIISITFLVVKMIIEMIVT